ncbi:toxin TumE [Thiobaca trueperi]|uniref:Uncharacterized protein n=1 Tax=Thiobaca trueperi TaxID=127458 RepID=A0A4R3N016_9GAMM|nr:DUF6516 family protein [Thiobaca trueperi]TCT22034.1 hypothetical protein EDC35_103132 [Thiobaca trueperi]
MPPLDPLARYLQEVETTLEQMRGVVIDVYVEELLTPARANLRIRLRFDHGCLLEVNEALVVEQDGLRHLDYRYHCQDGDNRLVFRYDSTPHFPDLPGFPFHKHLPDDTLPADRPTIAAVLAEAAEQQEGAR